MGQAMIRNLYYYYYYYLLLFYYYYLKSIVHFVLYMLWTLTRTGYYSVLEKHFIIL